MICPHSDRILTKKSSRLRWTANTACAWQLRGHSTFCSGCDGFAILCLSFPNFHSFPAQHDVALQQGMRQVPLVSRSGPEGCANPSSTAFKITFLVVVGPAFGSFEPMARELSSQSKHTDTIPSFLANKAGDRFAVPGLNKPKILKPHGRFRHKTFDNECFTTTEACGYATIMEYLTSPWCSGTGIRARLVRVLNSRVSVEEASQLDLSPPKLVIGTT